MGLDQYINYTDDDGCEVEKYYRKVNWLRRWMISNSSLTDESDCEEVKISRNILKCLLDDCIYVLDNRDKAEEVLPNQGGFFFGAVGYDDWYFNSVEDVKNDVEDILSNKTVMYVTYSDWW